MMHALKQSGAESKCAFNIANEVFLSHRLLLFLIQRSSYGLVLRGFESNNAPLVKGPREPVFA